MITILQKSVMSFLQSIEYLQDPERTCAPLMHEALGTVEQGAVRFSFSHFTTDEEVDTAIKAIRELAEE